MLDGFNEDWIERNGRSLDGGAEDRFRDRDQLGVELACGFSDIGVVETANKRGWQVVGHPGATVPNQLGVAFNAPVIEAILTNVAPALGWR